MGHRKRNECEVKGCLNDPYYSIRFNKPPHIEIRVCQAHEHRVLTDGYCTVTPLRDDDKDALEQRTKPAGDMRIKKDNG